MEAALGGLDISSGEHVETDLDNLITRRDGQRRKTEGERLTEDLWMPSARAYRERLRKADSRSASRGTPTSSRDTGLRSEPSRTTTSES
jgi:hypothetical protein